MAECARKFWSGGQNYSQSVSGEYVPCGGYTYEHELFRSVTHRWWGGGYCVDYVVKAELKIYQRFDKTRGYRFSCNAGVNGSIDSQIPVVAGTDTSILAALRRSMGAVEQDESLVERALRAYFSRRVDVYPAKGGDVFVSLIGHPDYFVLDLGEYVATDGDWVTEVRRSGGSVGSSCVRSSGPRRAAAGF